MRRRLSTVYVNPEHEDPAVAGEALREPSTVLDEAMQAVRS
ncbi:hypothetical protein ACIQMV_27575 [Streptomyces sp. NPDC091412]